MTEIARYMIPPTTMDGPAHTGGAEVEVRLLCDVVAEDISDGMGGPPVVLRTLKPADFAGPYRHSFRAESQPIPPAVLAACARAAEVESARLMDDGTWEDIARAVLEQVGRMLRMDDEASRLALGVAKLDLEKLARIGDELADEVAGGWSAGEEHHLVARWRGLREHYGPRGPTS